MTQSFQIHVKFKHVKVAVKRTVDKKKQIQKNTIICCIREGTNVGATNLVINYLFQNINQ